MVHLRGRRGTGSPSASAAGTYSGTFVDQQDTDAPEERMYPLGAIANERTAAALKAKGYVAGENAGHCDGNVQNATLADALVWIWRGYPTN